MPPPAPSSVWAALRTWTQSTDRWRQVEREERRELKLFHMTKVGKVNDTVVTVGNVVEVFKDEEDRQKILERKEVKK
jgi:hypothetical protein